MLELDDLVEDPEQVDAGEDVPPAEGGRFARLDAADRQLGLLAVDDARREVHRRDAVKKIGLEEPAGKAPGVNMSIKRYSIHIKV